MSTIRSTAAFVLLLWNVVACGPTPASAQAHAGRFLLISDIHFDPFEDSDLFGQLDAQPVERWTELLGKALPLVFNARGTDSNYALLKSSLDDAQRRNPDPDFILFPGDLLAHEWQRKYDGVAKKSHLADPASYRSFTAKVIQFLAGEFRRRYPQTAILPTLGNDDSYLGDYMITPNGPFLTMFADVWAPLLRAEDQTASFQASFRRLGCFTIRLPHMKSHRLVVLNSVLFSVNYENALGASTETPGHDQLQWLDATLQKASAAEEDVWLLMHIPAGINSYNSAGTAPSGGPPATFWQPELTSRFLQLVSRYATTLRTGFVGHTHMDDFRVIRVDGKPSLFCKIAPAVSPIFGNNPGYQIYQYDRRDGTVQNYQTYYLSNLETDGKPTAAASGEWTLEYDFRAAYGFSVINASTITQLADRMRTDAAIQRTYTRYYGVSAAPEFTPSMFETYRCAITNTTPAEFLKALSGLPKPKTPTPTPDRRRLKSNAQIPPSRSSP
jgi:sphingomyelin phosphodiesterase acid-like 3